VEKGGEDDENEDRKGSSKNGLKRKKVAELKREECASIR